MLKCSLKFQFCSTPFVWLVQGTGNRVSGIGVRVWCQFYLPFIPINIYEYFENDESLMHSATVLWTTTFKPKSNHFNFNEIFMDFVLETNFECANCSEFLFHNFSRLQFIWNIRNVGLTSQVHWSLLMKSR